MRLLITADGSHTVFNEAVNATYHSENGALAETEHVFIKNGLQYYAETSGKKTLKILEVGLGTGLNAICSLAYGHDKKIEIFYEAIEPFPLSVELAAQLNYADTHCSLQKMHNCSADSSIQLNKLFTFTKRGVRVQDFRSTQKYDLVYFDAFAFPIDPDVWQERVFTRIYEFMEPGGILVTYAAKGIVKRALKGAGFTVSALPGAPGKREMTRAQKVLIS